LSLDTKKVEPSSMLIVLSLIDLILFLLQRAAGIAVVSETSDGYPVYGHE